MKISLHGFWRRLAMLVIAFVLAWLHAVPSLSDLDHRIQARAMGFEPSASGQLMFAASITNLVLALAFMIGGVMELLRSRARCNVLHALTLVAFSFQVLQVIAYAAIHGGAVPPRVLQEYGYVGGVFLILGGLLYLLGRTNDAERAT